MASLKSQKKCNPWCFCAKNLWKKILYIEITCTREEFLINMFFIIRYHFFGVPVHYSWKTNQLTLQASISRLKVNNLISRLNFLTLVDSQFPLSPVGLEGKGNIEQTTTGNKNCWDNVLKWHNFSTHNNPHPSPPIKVGGVCCFLCQAAQTVVQLKFIAKHFRSP